VIAACNEDGSWDVQLRGPQGTLLQSVQVIELAPHANSAAPGRPPNAFRGPIFNAEDLAPTKKNTLQTSSLKVNIKQGHFTSNSFGKIEPWVEVDAFTSIGKIVRRTPKSEKGRTATHWNHMLYFGDANDRIAAPERLMFKVYDCDMFSDNLIGSVEVWVDEVQLMQNEPKQLYLEMTGGLLIVELTYTNHKLDLE